MPCPLFLLLPSSFGIFSVLRVESEKIRGGSPPPPFLYGGQLDKSRAY